MHVKNMNDRGKEQLEEKYETNLLCEECYKENENQIHLFRSAAYGDTVANMAGKECIRETLTQSNTKIVTK